MKLFASTLYEMTAGYQKAPEWEEDIVINDVIRQCVKAAGDRKYEAKVDNSLTTKQIKELEARNFTVTKNGNKTFTINWRWYRD